MAVDIRVHLGHPRRHVFIGVHHLAAALRSRGRNAHLRRLSPRRESLPALVWLCCNFSDHGANPGVNQVAVRVPLLLHLVPSARACDGSRCRTAEPLVATVAAGGFTPSSASAGRQSAGPLLAPHDPDASGPPVVGAAALLTTRWGVWIIQGRFLKQPLAISRCHPPTADL